MQIVLSDFLCGRGDRVTDVHLICSVVFNEIFKKQRVTELVIALEGASCRVRLSQADTLKRRKTAAQRPREGSWCCASLL